MSRNKTRQGSALVDAIEAMIADWEVNGGETYRELASRIIARIQVEMRGDAEKDIADTKRLMGALVRMKPKPHEEMKVGKLNKRRKRNENKK